jgi:hypothetical protein
VAKSRKTRAAKRGKPARKARAKARKASPTAGKTVNLKKLRQEFAKVLVVLSSKVGDSPGVTAKLDDTRRRISQWMTDIDDICTPEMQDICGPSMAIPVP